MDRQGWAAEWVGWVAWVGRRHQELGRGLQVASAVGPLLATWVVRLQDQDMVTVHHQVLVVRLHQEATWVGLRHQVKRLPRVVQSATAGCRASDLTWSNPARMCSSVCACRSRSDAASSSRSWPAPSAAGGSRPAPAPTAGWSWATSSAAGWSWATAAAAAGWSISAPAPAVVSCDAVRDVVKSTTISQVYEDGTCIVHHAYQTYTYTHQLHYITQLSQMQCVA
eukprot:COSAG02_NODE_919_length_15936_cov_5.055314_21_plen_224_part_00